MHTNGVPPERMTSLATLIRESLLGEYGLRIYIRPQRHETGPTAYTLLVEIEGQVTGTQYSETLGYLCGYSELPYHRLAEEVNDLAAGVLDQIRELCDDGPYCEDCANEA